MILITFGLAAAFSMFEERATQFVPSMWLVFLLALVVMVGVRLINTGSGSRAQPAEKSHRNLL
ncbi:MAG: hypothetical protein M3Z30_11255 [Gemmatimonadota bacterium]|nr:hypothetical protein [Gemmatimonadota bacterium]